MKSDERRALAALAVFSLLILLPGSGSPSQITRGDVYTYVLRVVIGFVRHGNWLVPHMGDAADFTKPPLFHWLLALAVKILPNPFLACRLPPILCSTATALLVFAFGKRFGFDDARGFFAAALWLGCSAMMAYGRQPLLEAPLALSMLAAFYCLVRAHSDDSPIWLYAFGTALGASSMIKWIVGPLTIGLFAVIYLAISGGGRWLLERKLHAAGAVALSAAVALPWPLYALATNSNAFIHQLRYDLFHDRYAQYTSLTEFLGRGVLIALAPWTFLLIPAAWQARRLQGETRWTLAAWFAAVLLPCLMITARTSRYAFPAVPALALSVAALWRPGTPFWKAASRATAVVLLLLYAAAFAACSRLGLLSLPLAVLGLGLGGAAAALAWSERLPASAAAGCLCATLLAGPATQALGLNVIPPNIIAAIGGREAMRFRNDPESAATGYLQLYLGRDVSIIAESQLPEAMARGAVLIVSGSDMERLEAERAKLGAKEEILGTWESPHTNPLPEAIRDAVRSGSLSPVEVRHSLVLLSLPAGRQGKGPVSN